MPTEETKIKSGLLAYGMSGKVFHGPFLEAHPGFELTAVVERHQKKAKADYPTIRSYDTIEDFIKQADVDLVVVNTPNNLHFEHAQLALENNKHVLIEKPICTTIEELDTLFHLADKVNKQVLFYQNRRWDSDFQSCIAVLQSGEIGKLHEMHLRFDRFKAGLSPKTFKEVPIAGSGIQFDLGPHVLDQAISLFGKPLKYYKRLIKVRPVTEVADFFSIQLSYADNLEVFLTGSLMTYGAPPSFQLYGDNGSFIKSRTDPQEDQLIKGIKPVDASYGIEQNGVQGKLYVAESGAESGDGYPNPRLINSPKGDYMQLFDAVHASITKGVPYPITRDQIRWQLEILSAAPQ